jgi:hypothetical protein
VDDGIRLDDNQMAPPVRADPGERNPESTIGGPELRSSGCPLQDFDLVPQGEVLDGQLLTGAQARDARAQEKFGHGAPCYGQSAMTATGAGWTELLVGTGLVAKRSHDRRRGPLRRSRARQRRRVATSGAQTDGGAGGVNRGPVAAYRYQLLSEPQVEPVVDTPSQASPMPSWSTSAWSTFAMSGQLSQVSPAPSPS